MGYNLIAIEDYLDLYSAQDKLTDTALLLSATSHSAWQGEEMIELMKYINANPELRLIGFDVPYYTDSTYGYMKWKIKQTAPQLYDEFYKVAGDDLEYIDKCWEPDEKYDYSAGKQKAIEANTRLIEKLKIAWQNKPLSDSCQIVLRFLENRIFFINSTKKGDDLHSFYFRARDKYMADNLEWIFREFSPNEKVIVISHNMHINKVRPMDRYYWTPAQVMGTQLRKDIIDKSYMVALNAYQGQYRGSSDSTYNIGERKKGIEKHLFDLGYKYCLLDLKECSPKLTKFSYREKYGFKMDLAEAYDAILFVDTVGPNKVLE